MSVKPQRVVVVGAGIGGLVAALRLAVRGMAVAVVERADSPGGKMREVAIGGTRVDAGPTVFTMRWVFEEIFSAAGASLSDHVTLRPAEILARHAWSERERLDLFADRERSAEAIGTFAGAGAAQGYRRFCAAARRIYETLERPFILAPQPSVEALVRGVGFSGLADLWRIQPFVSLWRALGDYFPDPRLRQLFGRYATYCGSSPFAAPATLMLVAHVEQDGVWLVEGGMHKVAAALAALATRCGAVIRYQAEASEILTAGGRVRGVRLATDEVIEAEAVVVNADAAAVVGGLLGPGIAHAVPAAPRAARSLSAVTWAMVAKCDGFPLLRHTVFFSDDYAREFDDIVRRARLPAEPTVYVCAQDRDDRSGAAPPGPERLLCLVNAPPTGDAHPFPPSEIASCETSAFRLLERCGLNVERTPQQTVTTTPTEFGRLFPATGGALYGRASHGWTASFGRPGVRTRLAGLYLAGGSAHPGPGVPMAALSGRMAADCLIADFASTRPWRRTVMRGGTSTP